MRTPSNNRVEQNRRPASSFRSRLIGYGGLREHAFGGGRSPDWLRIVSRWQVIALFLFISATAIRADSPLPPAKRYEVESPSKRFIASVDPKRGITVQVAGAKEPLWRAKGIWSREVVLSDDGDHFVTGYNGLDLIPLDYTTTLVLVTFWQKERRIRELTVGDLFPDTKVLRRTLSHYEWRHIQGIEAEILTVERCDKRRFDIRTRKALN